MLKTLTYHCNLNHKTWSCDIKIHSIGITNSVFTINANGNQFLGILYTGEPFNVVSFPMAEKCADLSRLSDVEWNYNQLSRVFKNKVDGYSLSVGIELIHQFISNKHWF